jgi:hypothetical protein
MAIAPSDPECMYAGTGDGRLHRSTNILAAAPQWTDISAGLPKRWITDIAVKRDDPRVVLVTVSGFASGHVFLSTNAGAQWKDISGTGDMSGLPDIPCNAILLPPSSIPLLCIATDLGVFTSRYLADSVAWERIASPLDNMIVTDLAIDQNHRLYAATHGRGVWVTDLILDAQPPDAFRSRWFEVVGPMPLGGLAGNTGSAAFSVPERTNVSLSLFNARGSRVLAVQKGMFPPGEHRITFDVVGIPAGIYYCRFESETYTATRKIVLMR